MNWPAGDVSYDLYLANAGTDPSNGLLLREAPETNPPGSFTFDPASMNTCEDMPFLGFVGDTLTEQLTLAGAAEVELYVTNSTPDADYVAMLYDYRADSDDPFVFVSSGGLRARYRNGFETAAQMSPNELTSLAFELTPGCLYVRSLQSRCLDYHVDAVPNVKEPAHGRVVRRPNPVVGIDVHDFP